MKTVIKSIALASLLLSTSAFAQAEKPLRKLSIQTLQGVVLEFFSKPEEPLAEAFEFDKDSILCEIQTVKTLQTAQQLEITAFIKPEKELEEPLDPTVIARFAHSEEDQEVK